MKKIKCFYLFAVCIMLLSACVAIPPDLPTDTTTYRESDGKPIKRTPILEGNFEIIQGSQIQQPINMKAFEEATLQELAMLGYTVGEIEEGAITAKLLRNDYWVQFKVCYWTDEFWFEYMGSENLEVTPDRNIIHRNYYRWIANLDKRIVGSYYQKL
ncbi:MAG: hypothetical protein LBV20_01045 [Treponema sp.]|jgi:hypothetical protein|nr:hypothetical protein [Treponema sp.]